MKKLFIISIAASLLFVNCTKTLSSLNHDPKNSSNGIATALFLQGELNLVNAYTTTSIGIAPFRVISQEWTENEYTYEANYNFSAYNSPGGWWDNLYVNSLHNLGQAKQSFPVNFLGTPGQLRNDVIITDLLEVYAYNLLVATYGDIPYTQAQNTSIPFPKYDDAKTVYTDLLTRLDTCIAGLDATQDAMGSADQIYGGNVAEWIEFAASLKLKMALLIADEDPTTASTKVNEAITTGVFQSNADNALFSYDAASPVNSNPIWNAIELSGRHDFGPSNLLVNTMVGWNDPRLSSYFTQYNGAYSGGVPGFANLYGKYSDFCCNVNNVLSQLYSAVLPGDILDYAEVQFNLAEAVERGFITGSAATYYNAAITASIQFWEGSSFNPGDATTYLAQAAVNYATATGAWRQKIGYQEWIAFYNRNWDSWTGIRRFGFPDIDVVNPPVSPASTFPLRLYYPPNEVTSNPANWAGAVANLPGGLDVVTAKLFWEQ